MFLLDEVEGVGRGFGLGLVVATTVIVIIALSILWTNWADKINKKMLLLRDLRKIVKEKFPDVYIYDPE